MSSIRSRQGWRNLPSDTGAYVGRLTASCTTLAYLLHLIRD